MSSSDTTRILTPEELTIMDLAVREARRLGYCEAFEDVATIAFNLPVEAIVDSDDRSCQGYDREGWDSKGYDRAGFNKEGRDVSGRDKKGYDVNGFDRYGLNKDGVDAQGRDRYRFDRNGWDREGYNYNGHRRPASRDWYTAQMARPETDFRFSADGYSRPATEDKNA